MKSILLCEGKTDAILISYYFNKVNGWKHYGKKDKRKVNIPIRNDENEEINWYTLGEKLLAIWGVGGKDNFKYSIKQIVDIIKFNEESFVKIIVLRDRDQYENDNDLLLELSEYLENVSLKNNEWSVKEYVNDFKRTVQVSILPVVIPFDKTGALETFILDAICEMGQEEKQIVDKSKEYISNFNLNKYLNTQRLKTKGEFAVTLGTMFPQKTFTLIDDMLKEINWVEYRTIQEGFKKLEEI